MTAEIDVWSLSLLFHCTSFISFTNSYISTFYFFNFYFLFAQECNGNSKHELEQDACNRDVHVRMHVFLACT